MQVYESEPLHDARALGELPALLGGLQELPCGLPGMKCAPLELRGELGPDDWPDGLRVGAPLFAAQDGTRGGLDGMAFSDLVRRSQPLALQLKCRL